MVLISYILLLQIIQRLKESLFDKHHSSLLEE
jgi:hypothetical protein